MILRCDISLSRWIYRLVVLLAVLYSSSAAVRAQESSKTGFDESGAAISFFEKSPQVSLRDPFFKRNVELELLGGGESSSLFPDARRPKITFLEGDVRLGLMRFLISRHFGLLLEGGYQHISNADIYPHNAGLNVLGAQAGLFYFF